MDTPKAIIITGGLIAMSIFLNTCQVNYRIMEESRACLEDASELGNLDMTTARGRFAAREMCRAL